MYFLPPVVIYLVVQVDRNLPPPGRFWTYDVFHSAVCISSWILLSNYYRLLLIWTVVGVPWGCVCIASWHRVQSLDCSTYGDVWILMDCVHYGIVDTLLLTAG